jgi:Ca2+-binding EF-hand superfamily protein
MSWRTILLSAAGAALILGGGAFAYHKLVMQPRFEQARAAAVAMALTYDTDKDGKLSREEIDAGLQTAFAKGDANADGKMDAAEFDKAAADIRAQLPEMPFRRRNPAEMLTRVFKGLDWNRDGGLEVAEVKGVVQAAAGFADRNNDGFVAPDEMRRPWGRRGQGHTQAGFF